MFARILTIATCSTLLVLASARPSTAEDDSAGEGTDDGWVFLKNDSVRVGVLRSHGGAIAYLSAADSPTNLLNHYDHGRLVQQSYYGDADGSKWAGRDWRYNPVQGGDYKGKAAKLLELRIDENPNNQKTLYTKTIPRHWASGKLLTECVMQQTIRLNGPVVNVHFQFGYKGQRLHKARHQETPAVFVSPSLSNLVTYSGQAPWTGGALSRRKPGWPNEHAALGESWAAYVDDAGNGLGVYVPGSSEATCYRYQGGSGSNCSYIAPLRTFALSPGLSFAYDAYFTVGDVTSIRQRFRDLRIPAALPDAKSQKP